MRAGRGQVGLLGLAGDRSGENSIDVCRTVSFLAYYYVSVMGYECIPNKFSYAVFYAIIHYPLGITVN